MHNVQTRTPINGDAAARLRANLASLERQRRRDAAIRRIVEQAQREVDERDEFRAGVVALCGVAVLLIVAGLATWEWVAR